MEDLSKDFSIGANISIKIIILRIDLAHRYRCTTGVKRMRSLKSNARRLVDKK